MSWTLRLLLLLCLPVSLPLMAGTFELTVTPAPAAGNLYRWQLLPGLLVQKPGDAVEAVHRAALALKEVEPDRDVYFRLLFEIDNLRTDPLAKANRRRIAQLVARFQKPLDLVADAARRERTNWEFMTERLRKAGLAALLEEVQEFREFLSILHLQARHHVLEDRPEQAVQVAATAFSLCRKMSECPTHIAHLVSLAIGSIACDILHDCIQHPRCPGLWGPLSDLSRPLVPVQRAYEGEQFMCHGSLPGLAQLRADPLTPLPAETLDQVLRLYRGLRRNYPSDLPDLPLLDRITLATAMKERQPLARKVLLANGYDPAIVEKMPIVNAALLHAVFQYEEALGRMMAAAVLPFPQAQARMAEIEKQYPPRKYLPHPEDAAFPLVRFLLPHGSKMLLADLRLQRRLEMLRTAEALRQHAFTTGKWPDALTEVRAVPLPGDPATLRPFDYRREGDVAILDAPLVPGDTNKADALQLRLTLRKSEEKKP